MQRNIYNINNIYNVIKKYIINFDDINNIICDPYLKKEYPDIFVELEQSFMLKNISFIYNQISDSSYPIRTMIKINYKNTQFSENDMELILTVVNYNWLNNDTINEINESLYEETTFDNFIDGLISKKYSKYVSTIKKLNLNERFVLADRFNTEIKKDCINTINYTSLNKKMLEIERHKWLDCLSIIPKEIINITHNSKEYTLYI